MPLSLDTMPGISELVMRIVVLPRAEEDISESALYIAKDSLEACSAYLADKGHI